MVEKLKFIHMTGPKEDLDRVMAEYLERYEIHFEPAISVFGETENITSIVEINPYRESYELAKKLRREFPKETFETVAGVSVKEAARLVEEVAAEMAQIEMQIEELEHRKGKWRERYERLLPFCPLDYELGKLAGFEWMKVWFLRIPTVEYPGFQEYVGGEEQLLFYECSRDREAVWGVCFAVEADASVWAAAFSFFGVEQVKMEEEKMQTPEELCAVAETALAALEEALNERKGARMKTLLNYKSRLCGAYECLRRYGINFAVREYAAYTKDGRAYLLCGFLRGRDAMRLLEETKGDRQFQVSVKDAAEAEVVPPTKLSNPALIRPFEFLVELYGLPAYGEIDPTFFVALTYNLMFGIMFGDVGQGRCLLAVGVAVSHIKLGKTGRIISYAGAFSAVFGIFYGSVFGFENVLPPVWRRPADNIGTTLLLSVGFGIGLILSAMVLNIVNGIRAKEPGTVLFSENGVAGVLCYSGLILWILGVITERKLPLFRLAGMAAVGAVFFLFFQKPLIRMFDGKTTEEKKEKDSLADVGVTFMERLVELFDVLMGYLTNSISFVRLGAFALSHAGMMGIVLMLSGYESGNFHWALAAFGNLLVLGMEGLVAAIQVLRLEYYEMFGRFYKGNGKAFMAFGKQTEREDGMYDN